MTTFLQNIPFFLRNYFGVGLNMQAIVNVVSRKHSRRYRVLPEERIFQAAFL